MVAQKVKPVRTLDDVPTELLPHRQHHNWVISHILIYADGKKQIPKNAIGYTERSDCSCGCWVERDYGFPDMALIGTPRRFTPKPYRTQGIGYVSRQDARIAWFDRIGGVQGLAKTARSGWSADGAISDL